MGLFCPSPRVRHRRALTLLLLRIPFYGAKEPQILPSSQKIVMMVAMHAKLKEAIALFNKHEYFSCHEMLEEIWHEAAAEERNFYEGLIRFATGLHLRFNRRNPQGAINLLTQGLMRLEDYRPTYQGVDVARLYTDVDTHLEELRASKNAQAGFFERRRAPRINLAA